MQAINMGNVNEYVNLNVSLSEKEAETLKRGLKSLERNLTSGYTDYYLIPIEVMEMLDFIRMIIDEA
jgi:hypothetical protein